VDVATRFREYTRLEKKRAKGGLTPAELRRWVAIKRMLSHSFSPGIGKARADQRASVRVPTRLGVSFATVGEIRRSLMTNLSRGGVFLRTEDLVDLGTRLELCVHIDESGEDIRVRAEVVSHNVGPGFGSDEHGMGLRFLDMDEATQKQIEELYERSLRELVESKDG
jgi:uncharacterized protein (TIGR02266 family)